MSGGHEPSYYEIALTNRQVLTVFVILLLCVVAAFFSGIWVGTQERRAAAEPVAAAVPETETEPAAELGDLDFFKQPAEPAEPPARERPEPARPAARENDSAAVRAAPPPRQEAPAPPPSATPPAPAVAAELVVQVFSSGDRQQAERVLSRLVGAGYAAVISPVQVEGQTMHRVRIGPFSERDQAQQVADKVRRDFKLDTWITR